MNFLYLSILIFLRIGKDWSHPFLKGCLDVIKFNVNNMFIRAVDCIVSA